MIYLDNAATTYPKPPSVGKAVEMALRTLGANPGRGGHSMSLRTAEEIYRAREETASFFGAEGPECVAFPLNCTAALNYVIKGCLKPGDHCVISNLEHNAVMRPLTKLSEKGIAYTEAEVVPGDNDQTVSNFRNAIRPNTRLIVCTHVSNVWGVRLPVERIAALASQYEIPVCVDCAQSAGVFPISMQDGYSYLCIASHKGLYAPMGTGILICRNGEELNTIIEGGTGTESASMQQPAGMPERMESGTLNVPGIAGLRAGIGFVRTKGIERICTHEVRLMKQLYRRMHDLKHVILYTPEPDGMQFAPVFAFNIEGMASETVGSRLAAQGIAVRAGLHCAPAAHTAFGTMQQGAVRVCPSAFTTEREIAMTAAVVEKIAGNYRNI